MSPSYYDEMQIHHHVLNKSKQSHHYWIQLSWYMNWVLTIRLVQTEDILHFLYMLHMPTLSADNPHREAVILLWKLQDRHNNIHCTNEATKDTLRHLGGCRDWNHIPCRVHWRWSRTCTYVM